MINEALAEEVRRGEMRKKGNERVATRAPETVPIVLGTMKESTPAEWREDPIEPDPSPKRRLLMKSASSAASSSGQKRGPTSKRGVKMQVEDTTETRSSEGTATPETQSVNT